MNRYTLGPARGGEPPWCLIYDRLYPSHPIVVHGARPDLAEDRAVELIFRLNDPGFPVYVEIIEPKVEAEVIPIGKGKVRR